MAKTNSFRFIVLLEPNKKWLSEGTFTRDLRSYLTKRTYQDHRLERLSTTKKGSLTSIEYRLLADPSFTIWDMEKDLYGFANRDGFEIEVVKNENNSPVQETGELTSLYNPPVEELGAYLFRIWPIDERYMKNG